MTLLEASVRFPTVVFTIGLGIALLYWIFVLLGALDIDLFGGDVDVDVGGAGKGLGDAIAGAGKGTAEVAKGTPDGGVWDALGLASVPITVSVSIILLLGWTLSLLGMYYLGPEIHLGGWFPTLVFFVAFILGVLLGGLAVRPLAPVFKVHEGKSNRDYVGSTCTVTTGHVDDDFGQATVEDGGTVLVIPVRCDRAGALARGQRALIIDYDDTRHAYLVEPADPFSGN